MSGDLLTSMKKASQRFAGAVADTGAKTMLKTDIAFLERDIKSRKHAFGIEIYDILQSSSATATTEEVQKAYGLCQNDIKSLESKVNSKRQEMEAIDRTTSGSGGGGGFMNSNVVDDAESPGIPSTP
jgi:hypothetical protein